MKEKLYFVLSMVIFGAVGVFAKYIDLSSIEIALFMSLIGGLLLFGISIITKNKVSWPNIKKNALALLLASIALSLNWVFLFQSYKETTIANAALSYYFAPVLVIGMSPIVLKEKLSLKKCLCACAALFGLILILQSASNGEDGNHLIGIVYGLIAATFYAILTLTNKFIRNMNGLEITIVQLLLSSIFLIPVLFITQEKLGIYQLSGNSVILILILGILHAGVGFYLFFSGMKGIGGQSIAILSYVDPLTSLLISALVIGESMTLFQIFGAILLLGSTFMSEVSLKIKYPYRTKNE
ncbi:DMT family transporter [Paenibacillus sp. MZ03-122A]|uniref:DMT family transporter n=1 Tax=Paenibacillus sp. MZ03-122A TaxID=2962033 RepID=UPI0020B661E6|nr:DMT family transporter [Paenibacillus sp. MZ03-122A]MCP3779465.1 DMT family transporter [Paenibacillus sp. MZ03-122A]